MALGGQRVGDALAAEPFLVGASPGLGASSVARLRVQPTLPASFPDPAMRSPEKVRLCGRWRGWRLVVAETA